MWNSKVLILSFSFYSESIKFRTSDVFLLFSESEDEKESENIRHDIEVLERKRSELMKQREELDRKLKEGSLLNMEEERR